MEISKNKIQLAMAKAGFSSSKLAETAQVSRQTVSYILHGKDCSPKIAGKLASALGIPVEEILEKEE